VQPLKILLVEPNADVQEAFAALLSCVGYVVEVAASGGEALAIAARNPPDVALLELSLKDMSGLDLSRALRNMPGTQHCTVIAITTYCNPEQREDLAQAGLERVLLKPVSLMDMVEALRPTGQKQCMSLT